MNKDSMGGGGVLMFSHQILNDTVKRQCENLSPPPGSKEWASEHYRCTSSRTLVETGQEFHFPLRLRGAWPVINIWFALTCSHVLLGLGLRHRLLHLRDHQVCGGEELVGGYHQPDCTAAHHRILCGVSCLCLTSVSAFFVGSCKNTNT